MQSVGFQQHWNWSIWWEEQICDILIWSNHVQPSNWAQTATAQNTFSFPKISFLLPHNQPSLTKDLDSECISSVNFWCQSTNNWLAQDSGVHTNFDHSTIQPQWAWNQQKTKDSPCILRTYKWNCSGNSGNM